MKLSEEQTQVVAQRLAEGASIADIQRLINDDFGIAMTYMEARFLLDDLNLDLVETKKEEPEEAATPAADDFASLDDAGNGTVSVDVDKIKRPGALVSGSVTFSDGAKATWMLDQMGRLALDPEQEGYQPSEEDVAEFQSQLQSKLQGPGI